MPNRIASIPILKVSSQSSSIRNLEIPAVESPLPFRRGKVEWGLYRSTFGRDSDATDSSRSIGSYKWRRLVPVLLALSAVLWAVAPATAHAAITAAGDVGPADPATWTTAGTTAYVGNTSTGTVAVDSGSSLASESCYIGYFTGATGLVTVDGHGSTWTNAQDVYVGWSGSGILAITGGATVNVGSPVGPPSYTAYVGGGVGGTGLILVDGIGSTFTGALTWADTATGP